VAFEDAPIGIEAGIAAGMVTVAVMTSFTEETFRRAPVPPTLVVRDFDDYLAGPGAWLLS
jgi:beta-phosphoglucomutase-like phosphatase (HAD superfamily)